MARSVYEKKAHKELLTDGYKVDYKTRPPMVHRGYSVDLFGLFDLMALKPGEPFIRWISIKGLAGNRGQNRKEIQAFTMPEGNRKELWWTNSKKEWVKEVL